ncbi:MAG: hypothetical protein JST22_03135 [Bacteroidetes bacterium]|nr:hypothetical protein [Bacteroidota bacterium]
MRFTDPTGMQAAPESGPALQAPPVFQSDGKESILAGVGKDVVNNFASATFDVYILPLAPTLRLMVEPAKTIGGYVETFKNATGQNGGKSAARFWITKAAEVVIYGGLSRMAAGASTPGASAAEPAAPAAEPAAPAETAATGSTGHPAAPETASAPPSFANGSFSIVDWTRYPENVPKPEGPFRLIEGEEYATARKAANAANRKIHRDNPSMKGLEIHEIHPVKFGGDPVGPSNKMPLTRAEHTVVTNWWNLLQRNIQSKP